MKIGAIVLAAGRSKRFGSDKRKAVLPNGNLVIYETLNRVLAVFDQVLVPRPSAVAATIDILLDGELVHSWKDAHLKWINRIKTLQNF